MSRLHFRFAASLLLVLLLSLLAVSWRAAETAETVLFPEIGAKADTVGRSATGLIERALSFDIPIAELTGVEPLFQRLLNENPELAFIGLYAPGTPTPVQMAGPAPPQPPDGFTDDPGLSIHALGEETEASATLVVGIDPSFSRQTIIKLWVDLGIVLVVTALVALELVSISFGTGAHTALEGLEHRLQSLRKGDLGLHPPVENETEFGRLANTIDARLKAVHDHWHWLKERVAARMRRMGKGSDGEATDDIGLERATEDPPASALAVRALVFLFMFADELNRPFLPVFIRDVAEPVPGLTIEFLISLPLVLFMAIVALSQPFLGDLTRRYGRGRSLMAGAAFGVSGQLLAALAGDMTGLLIARGITAAGFALVFVAAQGSIIDTTSTETRGRGLAIFVGAIMVASLCGPPIGGIIADRLGFRSVFLIGAAVNAVAFLMAWLILPLKPGTAPAGSGVRWRMLGQVFRSPRLAGLFFLSALPAKLILSACCFFLIPLHMEDLGYDQAAVGRVLMVYALAMVLLVPVFASAADRFLHRRAQFVAIGGVLAGLSGFYPSIADNAWMIAVMLLQLGIAQALSIGAQSALVGMLGKELPEPMDETTLYGLFRLVERSGSAIGPAVAGALLGLYGFSWGMAIIGAAVATGTFLFYVIMMGMARSSSAKQGVSP